MSPDFELSDVLSNATGSAVIFWDTGWFGREPDRTNHSPAAAIRAAMARKRRFRFIVFDSFAAAWCADFPQLAFDLE
jgi:hypothetical protein